MAPGLWVSSEWALVLVRARCDNVRFFSRLGVNYPVSERVYEAEAFGTTGLNDDNHTVLFESLPECFDD